MIHLGFEVGTGLPVSIPLAHMAVVGQTQESGKTTALEALAARLTEDPEIQESAVLAFITKRGESSFHSGRRVQPYFRDRADWQFVAGLIDAQLQEKNKFLRPWIMKICRRTKTLREFHHEVLQALPKARGVNEGVFTQLDEYMRMIVPEIARAKLADTLALEAGVNVMDISSFRPAMQMLFVQSALDFVNAESSNITVVIPEAWEFIPEGRGTPVKASAESLVRKGGALSNYIWVDSQDTAGIDKVILRGCQVWLLGVQREANELRRNLLNIPANVKKPTAGQVAGLGKGEFFACWKDRVVKVYVQPVWMAGENAQLIARGEISLDAVSKVGLAYLREDEDMGEIERLRAENEDLQRRLDDRERRLEDVERRLDVLTRDPRLVIKAGSVVEVPKGLPGAVLGAGPVLDHADPEWAKTEMARPGDPPIPMLAEMVAPLVLTKLLEDPRAVAALLHLRESRPEMVVHLERQEITAGGHSPTGWIARLIKDDFFDDEPQKGYAVFKELKRRGAKLTERSAYNWCDAMVRLGFLTRESSGGYLVAADMKIRVVDK